MQNNDRHGAARRLTILLGGLSGAAGVALSAASAHLPDGRLIGTAATMLLAHAPVLLVLAMMVGRLRLARPAALILVAGLVLFVADLAYRHLFGAAVFPYAAPAGGLLIILGWLTIALGAVFRMK